MMLKIKLHCTSLETFVGENFIVKTYDIKDIFPRKTVTKVSMSSPDKEDYTVTFQSKPYVKSIRATLNDHVRRVEDVMRNPARYEPKTK